MEPTNREDAVYMAKLAEQAERYVRGTGAAPRAARGRGRRSCAARAADLAARLPGCAAQRARRPGRPGRPGRAFLAPRAV